MAAVKRSKDDLERLMAEQLGFLQRSAQSFDAGFTDEAKRMAATIRVLVHQTNASHSLVNQLGLSTVKFYDTASRFDPNNLIPASCLVTMQFGGGEQPTFVAPIENFPSDRANRFIPFSHWWTAVVISDVNKNVITRKKLVLTCANQDGGAHVDPQLDATYNAMREHNSVGWTWTMGQTSGPLLGVELFSIRQIAHEVLRTLTERRV